MSITNSEKMTDEQKLQKAKEFKSEGNQAYKNKNFKQAIGKYHRALLHLKGIGQLHEPASMALLINGDSNVVGVDSQQDLEYQTLMAEVTNVKADCYNNLAACLLQQENPNYERVIQYCDVVLDIVPDNVKAIYRKGLSLYGLKDFDRAMEVFLLAQIDPLIEKYIVKCQKQLDKQEQNMKKLFSKMFESKQTDESELDAAVVK